MSFSRAQATAGNSDVLTDVLQNYSIDDWVSFDEFVAPTFINAGGVLHGQKPIGDTEALREEANTTHRVGEPAAKVGTRRMTYTPYQLGAHSLRFTRDNEEDSNLRVAGYDPDMMEMSRAKSTKLKLHIGKHRNLYTAVSTTGNYDSTVVNPVPTVWSSSASDPEVDVRTLQREIADLRGEWCKFGVINKKAFSYLMENGGIRAVLSDNRTRIPTLDDIRSIFDLDQLLVTDLRYDSGRTGDDESTDYVWGSIMLLFNRPLNPAKSGSLEQVQFMRTIRNEDESWEVFEEDLSSTLAPKGGYYWEYTVKQGYWSHELISLNASSDSICAGILTGLY